MSAEILPTHTPALFRTAVNRAAERLEQGDVVALPTETVYGLAANALDPDAVSRIYEIKGRPAHNPIIVHVSDLTMARRCASVWPKAADRLAQAFWPGPLTLVLPSSELIPEIVTAGGDTVGIRLPGHPLMRDVIQRCGFPVAAPSANLSNELSPTNSEHVCTSLGNQLNLIVDGGQAQVGIESTVVDLSQTGYQVLRPGMIHEESLRAALGEEVSPMTVLAEGETLRSPGNLPRHYAPRGRLMVLDWDSPVGLDEKVDAAVERKSAAVLCHTHLPNPEDWGSVHVIPHDAEAYARALYGELHRCDLEGIRWIIVEAVPDEPEWRGIADRLKRASTQP